MVCHYGVCRHSLRGLTAVIAYRGGILKYFGIPVALTWFMSQKTFDGKKPYSFLEIADYVCPATKVTYAGKAVKLEKEVFSEPVTAVRSVMYVPD